MATARRVLGVRRGRFHPRGADEVFVELLHAKDETGGLIADGMPHLLEQLHAFSLVLDFWIDLGIADKANAAAEPIHDQQMIFPGRIDNLQKQHPLHPPHFRAIAIVDGRKQALLKRVAIELPGFRPLTPPRPYAPAVSSSA